MNIGADGLQVIRHALVRCLYNACPCYYDDAMTRRIEFEDCGFHMQKGHYAQADAAVEFYNQLKKIAEGATADMLAQRRVG